MKIDRVKNGFIVEVPREEVNPLKDNVVMWVDTEKHVFKNLLLMLNFVNAYYSEETGKMVVSKEVDTEEDLNYK